MKKMTILMEFWDFLRYRKKFWLLPIVITLFLLAAAIENMPNFWFPH